MRTHGGHYSGFGDISPVLENQMEKELETGNFLGLR